MDNNQHDHDNNPRLPIVHEREPMTQGELAQLRDLVRESRVGVDRMLRYFKVSRIEDVYYTAALAILEKHVRKIRLRFAEIRKAGAMSADDPTINSTAMLF